VGRGDYDLASHTTGHTNELEQRRVGSPCERAFDATVPRTKSPEILSIEWPAVCPWMSRKWSSRAVVAISCPSREHRSRCHGQ
jgi:hypothetical protein